MLTKAILTGGVLSVLAGSIVYFGTEGADAFDRETKSDVRLESTELAGGADSSAEVVETMVKTPKKKKSKKKERAEAEAQAQLEANIEAEAAEAEAERMKAFETVTGTTVTGTTETGTTVTGTTVVDTPPVEWETVPETSLTLPQSPPLALDSTMDTPPSESSKAKPKTRWLDQYLKSNKDEEVGRIVPDMDPSKSEMIEMKSEEAEIELDVEGEGETGKKMMTTIETKVETNGLPQVEKRVQKKIIVKMDGDKKMVWSSDGSEGQMDENIDMEMIEKLLSEHTDLDADELMNGDKKIRIVKMDGKTKKRAGHHAGRKAIDYDAVLLEAKKLQVIDMRDEAFLEIVDYAVDRGDIGEAADVVDELSSPELRDTARARIGVGLATSGDMDAAFAVLDALEIDELVAPIRLEIISALMATREERAARREAR